MKRSVFVLSPFIFSIPFLVFLLTACATFPKEAGGEPSVYCKVNSPPNPLLMGGWKCGYIRINPEDSSMDSNDVRCWLVKRGSDYALYFLRTSRGGRKRYAGWRDWTIDGDTISSPSSSTPVSIYVQGADVYFRMRDEPPVKMNRMEF